MTQQNKALDVRLAVALVRPLQDTFVTPNHLTTLRLIFGIFAGLGLAQGDYLYANIGAVCFVISHFLDHMDGELARLACTGNRFGHYYDLTADALVTVFLFLSMGFGLNQREGVLSGHSGMLLGAVTGLAVAAIFLLRDRLERDRGREASRPPHLDYFDAEDVLYLLPLATVFEVQPYVLMLAAVGAPLFAVYTLYSLWATGTQDDGANNKRKIRSRGH